MTSKGSKKSKRQQKKGDTNKSTPKRDDVTVAASDDKNKKVTDQQNTSDNDGTSGKAEIFKNPISPEADDEENSAISEAHLIHTAILEKDNPFFNQHIDKTPTESVSTVKTMSSTITERTKNLDNPNGVYENDTEGLMPLYRDVAATSTNDSITEPVNKSHIECNDVKMTDKQLPKMNSQLYPIQILEATKLSEGQSRTYIAYTIKYNTLTVKRRYSDFESLHNILVRLFPTSLIPPIPEKQTIKNYGKAIAGTGSKYSIPSDPAGTIDLSLSIINGTLNNQDEKMIRHRIRMLTQFLNKLLKNKDITKTSIITDFLDPNNPNWGDFVASSATFSVLPKNVLQCNPLDPTHNTRIHASLPIPSSSQSLMVRESSDKKSAKIVTKDTFQSIEIDYKKYDNLMSNGLYKHNKRITKVMHEMESDYRELSECIAEYSLRQSQDTDLAEFMSHLSNTFDESAVLNEKLVSYMYYNINETLNEVSHMASAARDLIKYRRLKYIQKEIIRKTLQSKREQLKKMKQQVDNFKDIDVAIDREMSKSHQINLERPVASQESSKGTWYDKINKLAAIVKESVNYQEVDPKIQVATLTKDIKELENSLEVTENDLEIITSKIKDQELKDFTIERADEITDILKQYSKFMKYHAQKNLAIWQELKKRQKE